jgi:hypothetical protein
MHHGSVVAVDLAATLDVSLALIPTLSPVEPGERVAELDERFAS